MLAFALFLLGSGLVRPSVASLELSAMVRYADRIVVAQVESTCSSPVVDRERVPKLWCDHQFEYGTLRVERWLKGPDPSQTIDILNQGTWTCDTSGAPVGTRALYFLSHSTQDPCALLAADLYVESHAGDGARPLLHQVVHSGRGQMPLRSVDRREVADVWIDDVILPEGAPLQAGPEPKYEFIRSLPMEWLEAEIERIVRAQRSPQLCLMAQAGPFGGCPWTLALNGDRTGTLTVLRPEGTTARPFYLEGNVAWDFDDALRSAGGSSSVDQVGNACRGPCERVLRLTAQGRDRDVFIGALDGTTAEHLETALAELWRIVRGAPEFLDCPDCLDHRAADAWLLE